MDLGAPIGTHQRAEADAAGVSGGYGNATSQNTQAGQYAQDERSGFNAGVGGSHASGGIPTGTPIADKFTGSANEPEPYGTTGHQGHHGTHSHSHTHGEGAGVGGKLDNSLDQYSGTGSRISSVGGAGSGGAVGGAYEGSGTRDALTGQSSAHTTGAGVGVQGENLGSGHHGQHGARDAAFAGTAAGAGALAGSEAYSHSHSHGHSGAESAAPLDRGEGVAGLKGGLQPGYGESGSGVGPSGGAGGHYTTADSTGKGALGAGALGAGAGAAGLGAGSGSGFESTESRTGAGSGGGKYGNASSHEGRGQPLSNPKDLDTGGPHSLVYQESTGKYVHRRELEGESATKRL